MAIPRRNRFRRHLKRWPPKRKKLPTGESKLMEIILGEIHSFIKRFKSMNDSELKPGKVFFSKYLVNQGNRTDLTEGDFIPITVVNVDSFKNELEVDWDSGAGNETWNLEHCIWAFERGEYGYTKERFS